MLNGQYQLHHPNNSMELNINTVTLQFTWSLFANTGSRYSYYGNAQVWFQGYINNYLNTQRVNGATGATSSFAGITASGGAGGYTIPSIIGNSYFSAYDTHKNDAGGGMGGKNSYIYGNLYINDILIIDTQGGNNIYHQSIENNQAFFKGYLYLQPGSNGSSGYVNISNIRYK